MQTINDSTFRFVICVENTEYPASLEILKVYRVLPDKAVEQDGDLRVVDESGEDYIYPANYFILIDLPFDAAQILNHSFVQQIQAAD